MGCASSSVASVPSATPHGISVSQQPTQVKARVRDAGPTALRLFAVERMRGGPEPIEWMGHGERRETSADSIVHQVLRDKTATPDEIVTIIQQHRGMAHKRGHDGQYPLHIALQRRDRLPPDVLMPLIVPTAARRADLNGVWPFHKAVVCGAADTVLLALIDACPDALRCRGPYDQSTMQLIKDRMLSPEVGSAALDAIALARQAHDVSASSGGSGLGFSSLSYEDSPGEASAIVVPPLLPPPPPSRPAVAGSPLDRVTASGSSSPAVAGSPAASPLGRVAPFPPPRSP